MLKWWFAHTVQIGATVGFWLSRSCPCGMLVSTVMWYPSFGECAGVVHCQSCACLPQEVTWPHIDSECLLGMFFGVHHVPGCLF